MNNTIQVRIDQKTKQSVAKVFAALGLDMSTGVKIYFQQVLREQGIPFPLVTENGFTPAQEKNFWLRYVKRADCTHKGNCERLLLLKICLKSCQRMVEEIKNPL